MNARSLLTELCDRSVTIEAAGDELRLDAPAGAMTPSLLAAVRDSKADLLNLLAEPDSRADHEWDRFLSVAVATRGGLRDPAEPILQRGVSIEDWRAFERDCAHLGKVVRP